MGIIERKERERQEVRSLILEAAQQAFIEDGYEKASIRAIADRVEYSPATIYLYFKDKSEIFFAVHELGFEKLILEMSDAIEGIKNPLEKLRQQGYAYMKFALENPAMYDLMFIQNAPMEAIFDNEEWACGHRCFELICTIVQECIDNKLIKISGLELATMSIWSFMHGLVSLKIRNRFKMFPQEHIQQLMSASVEQMIELIQHD
ncbi:MULTISPECIES: TetR/AcrR family transcriptional regulator [unclassified Arcicella]|uniref:TetR/AcrR family transcriptional regulator n=1 Tax=unclassified Arcicella TaxID=2644986 RepID=UPI002861E9B7|nr:MULTISPECIES: TetR/AcrR family transcriptional regulator [unclassified Arcicella]MDR6563366.1 AcrR family transcriptional regulator [Arcicella sp. BE51]MDR6813213.1 AcrR family transcriptional regulator [Arcicella sp. BE140]MDR6824527.1 AcrR family transcriptional regulator [Arcicella sp. BE139]